MQKQKEIPQLYIISKKYKKSHKKEFEKRTDKKETEKNNYKNIIFKTPDYFN